MRLWTRYRNRPTTRTRQWSRWATGRWLVSSDEVYTSSQQVCRDQNQRATSPTCKSCRWIRGPASISLTQTRSNDDAAHWISRGRICTRNDTTLSTSTTFYSPSSSRTILYYFLIFRPLKLVVKLYQNSFLLHGKSSDWCFSRYTYLFNKFVFKN